MESLTAPLDTEYRVQFESVLGDARLPMQSVEHGYSGHRDFDAVLLHRSEAFRGFVILNAIQERLPSNPKLLRVC